MTSAKKRITALLLLFVILCGLMSTPAYAYSGIALDVEDHPVYRCVTARSLINGFQTDIKTLEKNYDGSFLAVYGILTAKSSDNKTFYIRDDSSHTSASLKCTSSKALQALTGIAVGDRVKVLGELTVSTFFTEAVTLKADLVEKTDTTSFSTSVFTTANGAVINSATMLGRSIEGGFDFYIPNSWKKVEYDLPNVKGFQYKLNELSGQGIAESVFIFYVDETLLKKPTDISNTTRVRKAIVENILCNKNLKMYSSRLPLFERDIDITSRKTDYAEFQYYTGSYTERNINAYNHRVEFAFIEDGRKDGVCAILYVYNTPEHANEVLFMMRMLDPAAK